MRMPRHKLADFDLNEHRGGCAETIAASRESMSKNFISIRDLSLPKVVGKGSERGKKRLGGVKS